MRKLALLLYAIGLVTGFGAETDIRARLRESPDDPTLLAALKATIRDLPEGDQRVRLSVIYSLGCLQSGPSDEAAAVVAYLKEKHPRHPDLVYLTATYTHDLCTVCDGDGYVLVPCSQCQDGRCVRCAGSGRSIVAGFDGERGKCLGCSGSGRCPSCDGLGKRKERCSRCGGAGALLSPDKVSATYRAVLNLGDGPTVAAAAGREVALDQFLAFLNGLCEHVLATPDGSEREKRIMDAQENARTFLENGNTTLHAFVKEVRYDTRGYAMIRLQTFRELDFEAGGSRAIFFGEKDTFLVAMTRAQAERIRDGAPFEVSGRTLFNTKPMAARSGKPGVEEVLTIYLSGTTRLLGTVILRPVVFMIGNQTFNPVPEP